MTQTRTFPLTLNSTTLATVTELVHFRDSPLEPGDKAAVYLEACFCNILLKSFQLMKFPNYEGDEDGGERLAKFSAAEMASQKVGLRILSRKNNTGAWREKGEIILTNAGRKSYFDLLIPYLAKAQVRLLEYNDALAVQLIDYGNGLLKLTDFVEIECAVSIEIEKKNDFETLTNRIQALENLLGLFGAATPNVAGTNGLVKGADAAQQNYLLRGDRTWQNPTAFATPAYIDTAILNLVAAAPGALDTLDELAFALGDDPNFATTITNLIATKVSNSGDETIAGNKTFSGFAKLGELATGIKNKLLTGTTAATQGGTTTIAHGLTGAKITGISGVIFYAPGSTVPVNGRQTSYASYSATDPVNFSITMEVGNSSGMLSKPFRVLIWYIE